MRALCVVCAVVLLGLGTTSCDSSDPGSASTSKTAKDTPTGSTAAASTAATTPSYATKADRDKDSDNTPGDDTSNSESLDFGHAASTADRRAIASLIKRYYTVANAENGAKACAMLYITLAESVPEDYGHESAGPSYLSQGTTCPAVMKLLFAHDHDQVAAELPLLKVTRVGIKGREGLAILSFGTMPELEIPVYLERHTWKIDSLIASELP